MTQIGQPQDPRAAVRRALLGLKHPKLEARNFVELGMIPDVRVEDGRVVVTLALPVRQTPAREQFQQMVQATASDACPGWPVEVAVREMAPEERAAFSACAEGRAPAVGHQPAVHSVVAVPRVSCWAATCYPGCSRTLGGTLRSTRTSWKTT